MESASFGLHLEDLPAALCSFLPITNDEKHPWKEYLLNEFLSKPILEVFHFSRQEIWPQSTWVLLFFLRGTGEVWKSAKKGGTFSVQTEVIIFFRWVFHSNSILISSLSFSFHCLLIFESTSYPVLYYLLDSILWTQTTSLNNREI